MAPSHKKLSASIVVLLLVVMAADEIASVQLKKVDNYCYHLSGNFKGACLSPAHCEDVCYSENDDNVGGTCRGFIPARCYCITFCPPRPESGGAAAAASGPAAVLA